MSRIVTLGESMGVAATSAGQPLRTAGQLRLSTAGAESTVAIGLSRLGHAVEWIGVVGADELGARVLRDLAAERVGLTYSRTVAGVATGFMIRELATAELTRVTYYRAASAGSLLAPADVLPAIAAGADILHVTGITPALSESCAAAVQAAVEQANASGITVSFDVNQRQSLPLSGRAREVAAQLLPLVDILFVGQDELWVLSDETDPLSAAKELLKRGPSEVVVKRGTEPAIALNTSGELTECAAWPVQVIDVVGAGDSFVAGYLAAGAEGLPMADRLRWATTCAACTVGTAGDWEGLPTRADIEYRGAAAVTRR
ncbi:MAG: 2-dehydro-3-deoxygluconokinase [Pseudonocardiales bacterium]|jgi:2-dehydro-3-deoxygluconokinase|nr:2-dehydro-3-deoxygluconokinase [Pseudonocardiales bacterium]